MDLTGDYEYFCNYDDINRNYTNDTIVDNLFNFISARIEARIVAPATDTYKFSLVHEDGVNLTIDGDPVIYNWVIGGHTTNGTKSLTQNVAYDLILEWFEYNEIAHLKFYWEYGGNSLQIVPLEANWKNYEHSINRSPITVTVLSPI